MQCEIFSNNFKLVMETLTRLCFTSMQTLKMQINSIYAASPLHWLCLTKQRSKMSLIFGIYLEGNT